MTENCLIFFIMTMLFPIYSNVTKKYVNISYTFTSYRVFCLMGDGESAEGSVWEAMAFASYYKLDNLVAIFDVNRLGQSEATSLQHELDIYKARAEAFG